MSAWNVVADKPPFTGEQVMELIQRLSRPTRIRFSPAVKSGLMIGMDDGGERVIVCSWEDREPITAAVLNRGDGQYAIDGQVVA